MNSTLKLQAMECLRIRQQAAYPFSLNPGQVVFATNNDVQNEEIPGISDIMKFDGGLTSTGENL